MRSLAIRMAHAAIGLLAIAGTSSALDVGRSAENSVVVKRAADADAAAIADPDAHASADAIPDALANADADAIADASADPNAVAKAAFDLPLTSVASPPASRLAKRGASASLQPRFDVRCYNYLDYDAVSPKVVVPWKMSQRWIFAFERGEFRSIDRTLATSTKALAGGAHACVPVVNDEPGTPYGGSWAPRADPVETAVSEILNKTIHKPLPKGAASTPTPGPGTPSATPSAAALVQKASTAGAGGKGAAATPTPKPTPTAASVQFHQNASHAHTRPEQSDRPRLKPRAAAAAAAATTALPKSTVLYDEYRCVFHMDPKTTLFGTWRRVNPDANEDGRGDLHAAADRVWMPDQFYTEDASRCCLFYLPPASASSSGDDNAAGGGGTNATATATKKGDEGPAPPFNGFIQDCREI